MFIVVNIEYLTVSTLNSLAVAY